MIFRPRRLRYISQVDNSDAEEEEVEKEERETGEKNTPKRKNRTTGRKEEKERSEEVDDDDDDERNQVRRRNNTQSEEKPSRPKTSFNRRRVSVVCCGPTAPLSLEDCDNHLCHSPTRLTTSRLSLSSSSSLFSQATAHHRVIFFASPIARHFILISSSPEFRPRSSTTSSSSSLSSVRMGRCSACLLFLIIVISRFDVSFTRPRYLPRSKENDLVGFFTRSRSSQCMDISGPCYSSGHCCKGLLCVPRDTQEGPFNDLLLGQCIRESDLEGCESNADCPPDCRCIEFGRRRAKYCLPRSIRREETEATPVPVLVRESRPPAAMHWRQSNFKVNGGFGSYCETNSDCSPLTEQGASLCCQQVRRGRQLPKKMCDYLTPISSCIS